MTEVERTVIGTVDRREDAVKEIQRLQEAGYSRSKINVYGNKDRARTVERLLGVEVEEPAAAELEEDEDLSWGETIKNSFNFFVYDPDQGDQRIRSVDSADRKELTPEAREAFTGTEELLDPYTKDIAAGKLVIIVDNYEKDTGI